MPKPLFDQAGVATAAAIVAETTAPPKRVGLAPYAEAQATHQQAHKRDAPQVQTRNAAGHPWRVCVGRTAQLEFVNLSPCPPKDKRVAPLELHNAPPPGGLAHLL